MERTIGSRQIIYILSLFLIAQFTGMLLIFLALPPSYQYIATPSSQTSNPVSFLFYLVINIFVAVLIIMLILRYYKGDLFFKLLEAYIILFGSFFTFFILIGDIFTSLGAVPLAGISLILSLLLLLYKNRTNKFRNIITLVTCVGAGLFIGLSLGLSFGFLTLYLFLAFFAIYDYLAVFVLKFMIPFAKEAANRNLAFMISSADVQMLPGTAAHKKQSKEEKMLIQKIQDPKIKSLIEEGNTPIVSSIMLGNGDIILPLTLAVGSYALTQNIFLSIMIIAGAATGLIVTILLLRRYQVGLPAIPPLFSFISIALLISYSLFKPLNYLMIAIFGVSSVLSLGAMIFTLQKMREKARQH